MLTSNKEIALIILSYTAIVLLILVTFILAIQISKKRKLKYQSQLEVERQKLFKAELEKEVAILKERERILADLHDDVGGGLSSIRIMADLMFGPGKGSYSPQDFASKISLAAKDAALKMNTLIWAINTENDSMVNFCEYSRQYAVTFLENSTIKFHFFQNVFNEDLILNGNYRKNLFLIIKEALHNILKHSGATSCSLSIQSDSCNHLQIVISDDGGGFKNIAQFGNGIKNMQKRIQEIDGTISLNNNSGKKGAILHVQVTCRT